MIELMNICELTRSLGLNKVPKITQKVYEVNIIGSTCPCVIVKVSKYCVDDKGYNPHYFTGINKYYYLYLNTNCKIVLCSIDKEEIQYLYFNSRQHAMEIIKKKGLLKYLK